MEAFFGQFVIPGVAPFRRCNTGHRKLAKPCIRIIGQTADGAAYIENGEEIPISADSITSMNMWGFTPDFLEDLDRAFVHFYEEELPRDPQKAECYLPFVVDDVIRSGKAKVKVLDSSDKWFGVTYREDKEYVRDQIKMLKKAGVYPVDLWKN